MESELKFLDSIQIAAPCPAAWEEMAGDDRKRFCTQCQKNVYNLSDMSRKRAEDLVRKSEGRMCVMMYRRADGTVLTDNCPVGLRTVRNALVRRWAATAALVASLLSLFGRAHAQTPPTSGSSKGSASSRTAAGTRVSAKRKARLHSKTRGKMKQATKTPEHAPYVVIIKAPPAPQAPKAAREGRTVGVISPTILRKSGD